MKPCDHIIERGRQLVVDDVERAECMIELRVCDLETLAVTAGRPDIGYDDRADEKAEDQRHPRVVRSAVPGPPGIGTAIIVQRASPTWSVPVQCGPA